MQAKVSKIDRTTIFGGDVACASNMLPADPGVVRGPHPKTDHRHCACPRPSGDSFSRRLCAAQASRKDDSDRAWGGAAGRDIRLAPTIVGVASGHHRAFRSGDAAVAPRLDLVLVSPSTFERAPKRAARGSLEAAPLSSRAAYDRAVRRHRRQGDWLRWKHSTLLAHHQPLRGAFVARLLCTVLAAQSHCAG